MKPKGKVYLVGAGPGDPDLLTRKALRLLESADVVICDRLISAEVLALASPTARVIYAGKRQGQQDEVQEQIYSHMLREAVPSQVVVRLKCGDPMVFARGGEELRFLLEHGIDAEVVPGVSSAISAMSLAGIPLTYRGVAASFTVVAGHRQNILGLDWGAHAGIDTLVVLMGVENRELIAESLIRAGRPTSQAVVFIERASTDRERVVGATLGEMADGLVEVEAPAVLVIGDVVRLRARASGRTAEEVKA